MKIADFIKSLKARFATLETLSGILILGISAAVLVFHYTGITDTVFTLVDKYSVYPAFLGVPFGGYLIYRKRKIVTPK